MLRLNFAKATSQKDQKFHTKDSNLLFLQKEQQTNSELVYVCMVFV